MRFKEHLTNLIEIDDKIVYEYIKEHDNNEYNINDLLEFINTTYYLPNFSFEYSCTYDLKDDYFKKELERVTKKYND